MHTRSLLLALALPVFLLGCSAKTTPTETATFTNPVSANGQVTDPSHGKETGLSIGALSGVNGSLANGVATAYYFEDKATIVGLQLNIAAATEGKVYVAWLEGGSSARIRLGTLDNESGDVRHSLRFDTENDLRSYTNVVISLQQKATDMTPGPAVATGILKATKR